MISWCDSSTAWLITGTVGRASVAGWQRTGWSDAGKAGGVYQVFDFLLDVLAWLHLYLVWLWADYCYDSIMNKFACYTSTQYSYSTLGVIRVTRGNSLLKWGEWILSSPLLSPCLFGPRFGSGQQSFSSRPPWCPTTFFNLCKCVLSKPAAITISHTHTLIHSLHFHLLLMPEDSIPKRIFLMALTLLMSVSSSQSVSSSFWLLDPWLVSVIWSWSYREGNPSHRPCLHQFAFFKF